MIIVSMILTGASLCILVFGSFQRGVLLGLTISACVLEFLAWLVMLIGFYATRLATQTAVPQSTCKPDWSIGCVIPASALGILSAVIVGVMPAPRTFGRATRV